MTKHQYAKAEREIVTLSKLDIPHDLLIKIIKSIFIVLDSKDPMLYYKLLTLAGIHTTHILLDGWDSMIADASVAIGPDTLAA
jgi:hypothetical protein